MPLTMTTGGETYYYITNLQGDVTALMDDTGAIIDTYTYTPWGEEDWANPHDTEIGDLNPLRYRSYVYDSETGLYYLQSRYYNPEMGRFINADCFTSTGQGILGNNMFAYCNNNPILYIDSTGRSWHDFFQIIKDAAADSASYVAAALGISQLDSPMIGPADVAAVGVLVVGIVFFAQTATNGLSNSNVFRSIESNIIDIGQSFGKFQCIEAAESIAEYLRRNNKSAELVTITFLGGRGYIWSDIKSDVISENGVHVGVLLNGIVYCNVHPLGLPEMIWTEDFHGTGQKVVTKVPI